MSTTPTLDTPIFQPAARVRGFGETVFSEFTALAIQHGAINLGQGFPNFPAPDFIKQAALDAIGSDLNQYARGVGHPRLVNALAQVYGPLFGRELDPMREIVTTTGATEGIFATIQALVDPGDEVILIEPFYDSYPAATIMAGGTPVYVPLRPALPSDNQGSETSANDWVLDRDELAAAFNERTRLVVLNTPQNALGKVFRRDELELIAELVQKHDAYVLSDEVYEWMFYPETSSQNGAQNGSAPRKVEHVRIATLPGMWPRTVTLGSAGKTFSVTGWKIGWAIAPPALAHAIFMAHQWIPFSVATPLQEAVAAALEQVEARGYFEELRAMYHGKRDRLLAVLREVGLTPIVPDGSYFALVDTSRLDVPIDTSAPDARRDVAVCRWLTTEIGVGTIPPSPFYAPMDQHLTDNLARFCFCKTDEMLDAAAERLRERLPGYIRD